MDHREMAFQYGSAVVDNLTKAEQRGEPEVLGRLAARAARHARLAMAETDVTLKVELANKIEGGRAVGNLYGVGKFASDGRRLGWFLQPQEDEQFARDLAAEGMPSPPCWFCGGEGFHCSDCETVA